MLLSSNKRERHRPGHRRLPDGFDRAGPGWSLNFRFAAQYYSVWQIKPGLAPDFRMPGTIVASVYWIHGNRRGCAKSFGWAAWTTAIELWRGRAEKSDNLGNPYAEKMLQRRSQPIHE